MLNCNTYVFTRIVQKRATAVLFTNREDCVVISDKAGDVYRLVLEKNIDTIEAMSVSI